MDWMRGKRRLGREHMLRNRNFLLASFLVLLATQLLYAAAAAAGNPSDSGFIFQGFAGADLFVNGGGVIAPNGILQLTDFTKNDVGHAFYPNPFAFLNSSARGHPFSFSTSFVFAIVPQYSDISSHGIAFVISPVNNLTAVLPSQHLGLFNLTNNGDASNHIVAVELDTIQNKEFYDINDNHVGINVNGMRSLVSAPASFFLDSAGLRYQNLSLISGEPLRVWVEYDGSNMELNVTLAPLSAPKPEFPLLSSKLELPALVLDKMYVGFSASTGTAAGTHYILGWSFSMSGRAEELKLSGLPSLPAIETRTTSAAAGKEIKRLLIILLPIVIVFFLLIAMAGLRFLIKNRRKFSEIIEDWETEYGPHRFSYKDLHRATKGFSEKNILGKGGFGRVYKGLLPKSELEIAVKRISHDSKQGMKEFVAEIASIGRLRHRNIVQLLGYCRRRGELLLVYEFMPKGSLDKYIFGRPEESLGWSNRFKIIKDIAAGLLYLHEEWDQVVLHRDIKASNVLLDASFNGKLGDFGLARLHNRGSDLQTTSVVGTLGYLAPELSRTGKCSTSSDVFGFGAFLLEVACGKRPVDLKMSGIEMLVDRVMEFLERGEVVEARDRKLGVEYAAEEVEMVLMLGLMCSHPVPQARPNMRQVVQYLEGDAPLPEISENDFKSVEWSWSKNTTATADGSSDNPGTAPACPSASSSEVSHSERS